MEAVYEVADKEKIHEFIDRALKEISSDIVKITVERGNVVITGLVAAAIVATAAGSVEIGDTPTQRLANLLESEKLPVHVDSDGVVMMGKTRVPLDTVIFRFNEGLSPEEIVHRFTTLALADVYGVIGFYLREREVVDAYLHDREVQREQKRKEIESRSNLTEMRDRILTGLQKGDEA